MKIVIILQFFSIFVQKNVSIDVMPSLCNGDSLVKKMIAYVIFAQLFIKHELK